MGKYGVFYMAIIWIDIKNSHEPAFFKPFLNEFGEHKWVVTSWRYAELPKLLDQFNIKSNVIGKNYGGNKVKKMAGWVVRDFLLFFKVPYFDLSLSHGSINAIHTAKMRQKYTISFTDNDKAALGNRISFRFVDFLVTPKALPVDRLITQGAKDGHIIQYDGYKEDIYIADFKPSSTFMDLIPFDEFITIRPEALQATYVSEKRSIVPDLLEAFIKENLNILYLPRYPEDINYAKRHLESENLFIPENPLKGLDVCYYSRAVLTGSGTFAREAACMGTPAVSFYPEELLAVDQQMVEDGWIFHSRDTEEIVDYVLGSKKRYVNFERSRLVQRNVFKIFREILDDIEK